MRLFGEPQASHYCAQFSSAGQIGSYKQYGEQLRTGSKLAEGTPDFDSYRSHALRESERCLFLAVSCYRRSLDLLIPSSAAWATVTAYYGSWYAASALLHMFGAAILTTTVVEVDQAQQGSQQLAVRKIGNKTGQVSLTHRGPHKRFWEAFYLAMRQIAPLVAPHVRFALLPLNGSETWLIDHRNDINYDSHLSLELASRFQSGFDSGTFPTSLPAGLSTQYQVMQALIEVAFGYAGDFALATDAVQPYLSTPGLRKSIYEHVYTARAPSLVRKSLKSTVARRP